MKIVLAIAIALTALHAQGVVTTIAGAGGKGSGDAQLYYPGGVAFDTQDNLYIADSYNHRILKMTPDGAVTTLLGTGAPGKTDAQLTYPRTLAVDQAGVVYVADSYNQRVRKIAVDGSVTTIAGTGEMGDALTQLAYPRGVAVDAIGNVFVSDNYNHRVLRVSPEGIITNAAGGRGQGDGATQLNFPFGIAVDGAGVLYIGDAYNNRVQKVTPDGSATTLLGAPGGGDAIERLVDPVGVDVDSAGNVYVSDTGNNRIRKVSVDGSITTVAGETVAGAGERQLNSPFDTAVDSQGNLIIADTNNHRIQKITFPAPQDAPQLRHAATNRPEPGSPNQIMQVSPAMACPEPLEVSVGGYRAEVSGVYFVIPESLAADAPAEVSVSCLARSLLPKMKLAMRPAQPRLFTNWSGQALAEAADTGTIADQQSPGKAGSLVSLFGTGFGALERADALGRRAVSGNVTATVGGMPADVLYAGTAPGQTIGLAQINLRIPPELTTGLHQVSVSMDGIATQGGVLLPVESK